MKVRWTRGGVRLRITPSELAALERGEEVLEVLFLDGAGWSATISPISTETTLTLSDGKLGLLLAEADLRRLASAENEGVYFQTGGEPSLRYYIEKDFPCIHPRAADALEPPQETFVPPPGFTERKDSE